MRPTACADGSRAAGEDLFATAKKVERWLLIEYREKWESNALANLHPAARSYCEWLRAQDPHLRIALIRRPERKAQRLAVFYSECRERDPLLRQYELDRHEQLPSVDLARPDRESTGPLFLVCTHGTHDICCARYGNAVYRAMDRAVGQAVWQASHVGGCRFAPNMLCLPHGLVYGRLDPLECAGAAALFRSGCVYLSRLRGRSCYDKPVQAADFFLRTRAQLTRLDDLALDAWETTGPQSWQVDFRSERLGMRYGVHVRSEPASVATCRNCAAREASPRSRFHLVCLRSEPLLRGDSSYGMRSNQTATGWLERNPARDD